MTVVTVAAASVAVASQAPAPAAPSLVGAWTLNKDLSDTDKGRGYVDGREDGEKQGEDSRRRGGGVRGGGFGRGDFGNARPDQAAAAQRKRNALRDELLAPDHITIVQSETTIIITAQDGRTTRLSTDGKKIKDESTGIERRTKWDGGQLVSEINGLGRGKITETYSVNAEPRQLRVAIAIEGPGKTSLTRVYELDPK